MYIQKNKKTLKISWISVFFPKMGRAAQKTAQLISHLIPQASSPAHPSPP